MRSTCWRCRKPRACRACVDWYGRRAVLIPGVIIAIVAALLFITWESLAGLIVARIVTGVASGNGGDRDGLSVRSGCRLGCGSHAPFGIVARSPTSAASRAAAGRGIACRYEPNGLTLPMSSSLLPSSSQHSPWRARPTDVRASTRPTYRPQRLRAPVRARGQFIAATIGASLAFAVFGLFAGLAGTFLAGPLHHPSAALAGFAIFLTFGAGVVVQTTTISWPAHRLLAAGIAPIIFGLCVLVYSAGPLLRAWHCS